MKRLPRLRVLVPAARDSQAAVAAASAAADLAEVAATHSEVGRLPDINS